MPCSDPVPVSEHLLGVEGLEIPVVRLVKLDENGYDFTRGELPSSMTLDLVCLEQGLVPDGSKRFQKIIDMTKEFE